MKRKFSFSIVLICILHLFLLITQLEAGRSQKRFLNVDGGIGIGFYEVPGGATKGGLVFNVDFIPFNFRWLSLGFSSGILNLMKSNLEKQEADLIGIPMGLMIIAFIKKRSWNSFPYLHLTPGAYYLEDRMANFNEKKIGYGFAAGIGLFIPISQTVYIDLALRYHRFEVWNDYKKMFSDNSLSVYQILSSNFGIAKKF